MSAATGAITLAGLIDQQQWVAWRNEQRNSKPTKVPYIAPNRRAEADAPTTWLCHDDAAGLAKEIANGHGGGIGLELGRCGDLWLTGIDLDTCRNRDTGMISPWATAVLKRFDTYTEISPSGEGVKAFCLIEPDDVAAVRNLMGTQHGKQFKSANGSAHPPAIELYISNRYFAVTWAGLDNYPDELRTIPLADLQWLINEAGPSFAGKAKAKPTGDADTILARLERAASANNAIRTALTNAATMKGGSRSEGAFSLGAALKRASWSFADMKAALLACPATKDWANEKLTEGDRQFERIWQHAASSSDEHHAKETEREKYGVSLDDFHAYMPMHAFIHAPSREMWPGSSVNSRLPPVALTDAKGQPVLDDKGNPKAMSATAWLDKHKPVEQMTWAPGLPMVINDKLILEGGWVTHTGAAVFNLYRPPQIAPGDPTQARQWLDHIRYIYPDEAEHIVNWLAHRVQRPEEKINHALVLGGAQGIGKDSLLEPAKYAVGHWNFFEASPLQVLGRFNGFLKSVILRISEARDLGEYDRFSLYDHLKAYTAAPPDTLRVDEKHLREYNIVNCCGVIITTNHKTDGIHLPADDRRHFVAWSSLQKEDARFQGGYWKNLWTYYQNGGLRHVAEYLRHHDISIFDAKAPPPKTAAFWAIVDANRPAEEAELADAIDKLGKPDAFTLQQLLNVTQDADLANWLQDRKNRRTIPYRIEQCGYVPVRNPTAPEDGYWKIGSKRQAIYVRASMPLREQINAARKIT
jgi:hypothetical protein